MSEGICETCNKSIPTYNLRPYGPGGSVICFACATATPEADAEAKRRMKALIDGGARVITPTGMRHMTRMDQRIAEVAIEQGRAVILNPEVLGGKK